MSRRIDSPGKGSAFGGIHICLPVLVFRLSRRHEKLRPTIWCLLHQLRVRLSVPVGIVNKREEIQNPTLTAKAGQAYPKKILLMNWLFEKMNPLVVPVTGVKFKSAFLYA